MNWLVRGIFQPTDNRYWVGNRLHLINYLLRCIGIPVVFVLAIIYSSWGLALFGAVLTVLSVLDYVVFDRWTDKLMWKHFYQRHYGYESPLKPGEYQAIKQFDKQPTPESADKLKRTLKED